MTVKGSNKAGRNVKIGSRWKRVSLSKGAKAEIQLVDRRNGRLLDKSMPARRSGEEGDVEVGRLKK